MEQVLGVRRLSTGMLGSHQDERRMGLEGLIGEACAQIKRLLRLLLRCCQIIPFIGEPGKAEQRIPFVGQILSCCRERRSIQLGGLVEFPLEKAHLTQREQRRTRGVAVACGCKERLGFQQYLPCPVNRTRQPFLLPYASQTRGTPLLLTCW